MSDQVKWSAIDRKQITDWRGHPITSASHGKSIKGNATTVIFTNIGVFLGIGISKDVDGGTFYCEDNDGNDIDGLPDSVNKGVTDYAGTLPFGRMDLYNGLTIITENAGGIFMSVFSFQPENRP